MYVDIYCFGSAFVCQKSKKIRLSELLATRWSAYCVFFFGVGVRTQTHTTVVCMYMCVCVGEYAIEIEGCPAED